MVGEKKRRFRMHTLFFCENLKVQIVRETGFYSVLYRNGIMGVARSLIEEFEAEQSLGIAMH